MFIVLRADTSQILLRNIMTQSINKVFTARNAMSTVVKVYLPFGKMRDLMEYNTLLVMIV
jgi:hypothetical protein